MCGIIGYIGKKNAVPVVLEGLKRLEYRGYDSAGIAFFSDKGIEVRRCSGKIKALTSLLESENPFSHTTIGHTRWATHGRPSDENAHPHRSNGVVLVHNGIIENYLPLKKKLIENGYQFTSETDTEVLCHLVESYAKRYPLEDAVREALKEVKGTYAIAVIKEDEPGKIVGVRKDSPLVVGLGDREYFVASDVPAFLSYSNDVIFLDDGDMVVMTEGGVKIIGPDGIPVQKDVKSVPWSPSMAEKGGYRHFMLKEIHEQPRAIADTLRGRFNVESGEVNLKEFGVKEEDLRAVERIFIVACGTSYHAALIGKYMIEELVRVPVEVDVASEFRYRRPIIRSGDLMIGITQSGETADTLAAQREAKRLGAKTLSICNVVGSTSSREADAVFYTHSGPEIGVASTKAFTSQIVGLYLFAVAIGEIRDTISADISRGFLRELLLLPGKVEKILATDEGIRTVAKDFFKAGGVLYLGRGMNYPIALEGALKLKEISYIHAEGYPAGEMKHGPIALIDEELPVVVLAPKDKLQEKIISNIQEVKSRGGKVISITNSADSEVCGISDRCIFVPETNPYLTTVLMAVPVQLLAYHIGVLRGCDVDQPRNLAKSVTVE
ncbi:MAG: glutamine--fructose-6-phosphate aminotransferase [Thermodesulfovibrio sp. RBG_19FT_COMBO_42_12]|nr:MAG: glutamine--fructose-6-phosphate aminotransferase [Thermodesulfovibrio sp. RBG_19FT_COMBO_42_12]